MTNKFPLGLAGIQFFLQPLELNGIGMNLLIGVDHEETGIAVVKCVVVFGNGKGRHNYSNASRFARGFQVPDKRQHG